MAGSQLKNLKATLKAHGLTGQTNVKKNKKNTKRQPKEYDREEKAQVIAKIREQFNPFDVKTNRNKREPAVKDAKVAVGKPGISKQVGEEQRKQIYEAKKSSKNRLGGVLDRRFGERNKDLSAEEKMLERFTRERQNQSSSKKSLFNLDEDDDDIYGDKLTHYGKSLALEDDFDAGDLGLDDQDGNDGGFSSRSSKRDHQQDLAEMEGPPRKKTKAEVMKEVMAKSKFYKHERQKAQEKLEDQIGDLDENFDDIMSELASVPKPAPDSLSEKKEIDKEYDIKVKELVLERRAAPADRTKTEEELREEAEEKKQKLEQDRVNRMNGMFDEEEEKGVEDLDDGFWAGEDSEEGEYGEHANEIADSEDDVDLSDNATNESSPAEEAASHKTKTVPSVPCPADHQELLAFLENHPAPEHPILIKKVIKTHQPKLAEGNKERLGVFTGVLLQHVLFLANEDYSTNIEEFKQLQSSIISILKSMSEKYNQPLSEACREIISDIQSRFKSHQFYGLLPSDLVFFSLVGYIFSTSDSYHLVVTPCGILIGEFLEQIKFNSFHKVIFGAILANISLQYQRISKRYTPELTYFFKKSLATLLPLTEQEKNEKAMVNFKLDSYSVVLPKDCSVEEVTSPILNLHLLSDESINTKDSIKFNLLSNILLSLERAVGLIWKELSAFEEITSPFVRILTEYSLAYPKLNQPKEILAKITNLRRFHEHIPLTLQNHKPVSIPTYAPKFEENFNPDKKSYDPNRTRSEINKMKAQVKKERKFTMKEIRKDTRFEARQRIDEKKKDSAEYHAKMARIINTISTEEGAEKNKYEREKRLRGGKH